MVRILAAIFFSVVFARSALARDLERLYQKEALLVGAQKITAWIADDDSRREQGLMFIEKLPDDMGMLFVFEKLQPLSFWMKNTVMPLSIGFFDQNGVLIDIHEMKVASSLMDLRPPTYGSRAPALFALEMNAGWFSRHKIKIGSRLTAPGPVRSPLLAKGLKVNKVTRH